MKCTPTNDQKSPHSENGIDRSRARAPGSMGGDVPEKYYVVRNNDMMRVKYLLVYSSHTPTKSRRVPRWKWVSEHKFALLMMFYVLLLLFVGLYNSKSFHSFLRKYSRAFRPAYH